MRTAFKCIFAVLVAVQIGMCSVFSVSENVQSPSMQNLSENRRFVTRKDCIVEVMRAIGLTDEAVENARGKAADVYTFADADEPSYMDFAYMANIAYGVEMYTETPTYRTVHTGKNTDFFFLPDRPITVNECIAFMVRCLDSEKTDLTLAIQKAYEYGLINGDDRFAADVGKSLGNDDFEILIDRFLDMKRYKYYPLTPTKCSARLSGEIDAERTLTYREMLSQR